jgi:hypothetical protein NreA
MIDMIASERSCLEIAQQHAVERAIATAEHPLTHDHIDHYLKAAAGPVTREQRTQLEEFKAITKHL